MAILIGKAAIERQRSLADVHDMQLVIATTARTFLIPHWRRWHEAWAPPAPAILSQWTCLRSSLFLVRALERRGIPAVLRSGQPMDMSAHGLGRGHGLKTSGGWASHAWVEADGFVIDITADQFGHAPVVVTSVDDPAYRHADDEAYQLKPTSAGVAAVDKIWSSWCSYADRQHPQTATEKTLKI